MKSKLGLVAAFTVALSLAMPAVAHESGKWVLRAGAGVVSPKSNNFGLGDVDLGDGSTAVNSRIEVDDGTSLVLGATYMMNANWAIDILAAAPFEHDIDLAGSVNGSSISAKIGSTKHLPPTVSLQYHFAPEAVFQPYVGLGVNYTLFSSESVTSTAEAAGIAAIRLDDSFGAAAQLGADWVFGDNWLVNFDLRYIQIRSDLTLIDSDGNRAELPGEVEIDPIVYSLNIGYRF